MRGGPLIRGALILAAGVLVGGRAPAQTGVLVGVQDRATWRLRTVWLAPDAGGPKPLELEGLVVPRRDGFWRVGMQPTCGRDRWLPGAGTGRFSYEERQYLWSAPATTRPTVTLEERYERAPPCRGGPAACALSEEKTIHFVWPELISVEEFREGDCGAHPDASRIHAVRSLDDVSKGDLAIDKVLGAQARAALARGFAAGKASEAKEREDIADCLYEDAPTPTAWSVRRERGRWAITSSAEGRRVCGYGFEFAVKMRLPAWLARTEIDAQTWAEAGKRWADLRDLHRAPDASLWLVVVPQRLRLVPTAADAGAGVDAALGAQEVVVMVEWATGAHVARWTETLMGLRAPVERPTLVKPH